MKTSLMSVFVLTLLLGAVAVGQTSHSSGNGTTSSMSRQITNGPVAETIADSNAVIGWSSGEPAKGCSLRYGTDRQHLNETAEVSDNADGKNHHAKLEGLAPDTAYYFQVMQNGEPMGGIGTFRTVAAGEKPMKSKAVISQ